MLETSDPVATVAALEALGVRFERHDAGTGSAPDREAVADLGRGRV
jgi:hypothetical protein